MADYEQKPDSGSLFANDKKLTANHPDSKGKCLIGGVWYWASGWRKTSRDGTKKFLSLSFTPMDPQPDVPEVTAPAPAVEDDPEMPF